VFLPSWDHLPDIPDQRLDFFGIFQKITSQIAALMKVDDVRIFQDIQVLGDIWLGDVEEILDVIDALLAADQLFDDEDPDGMRKGFEDPSLLLVLLGQLHLNSRKIRK
jgi:hypothetical protein